MTNQALEKRSDTNLRLTSADVIEQIQAIQDVMAKAMKKDEHYGVIPGCGDKPALLKAGAEKLGLMFRLAPDFEIIPTDLPGGHREYAIKCTLTHIQTGETWGQGVGVCSTMESKYRWRKAERVCPKCGKAAIIKGKEEYGGGWVCFAKKGGCGAKFKADDTEIASQIVGRVENPDIADIYNTVLKIGKKRAHVDAIITATAASDIFTQDIEETVDGEAPVNDKPHSGPDPNRASMEYRLAEYIRAECSDDRECMATMFHSMTGKKSMKELTTDALQAVIEANKEKIEAFEGVK